MPGLHTANTKLYKAIELDYHELKTNNRSGIIGDSSGYYPIVSVHSNKKYLNAFQKDCEESYLDTMQFYNQENRLYYAYLADFIFLWSYKLQENN